ncbi:MAG: hypothetical protein Q4A08_09005 [Bacteroidales bacterium]|nr:hypothetical protein [Bacteroidales bacterium]
MRQEIKNKELRVRQKYVPASMNVIEINAQSIICLSDGEYVGIGDMEREEAEW